MEIDQFLIIMMVAVIVAIVAKYIRWPYTIMLLLSGLVIAYFNIDPPFVLDKKMIFHILLPPLIFEGALHMRLKHLKENAKVISLLAIPALILSSFFVGYLIYLFTASSAASAIPFTIALLIAIIIIPTDPVSILAIYKETKLPTKLKNIIEGESIFDDGTCLVLFAVILDLIRVGNVDILTGITDFLRMAIFGILLGLAVGYILYMIISKIDDKFTEVMITLIMVFGLFAMAENMGASGVFAVVMAGLILGNYGTRFAMAPSARHTLLSFWGFIVFLVNSFLFIVVGMNVNLGAVWDEIGLVIFSVLALWSARALSIYIIGKIVNRGDPHFLPNKWQIVMWWGGLRGAIPIALALSIPIF
ncbi:MAG: cation:proton antiporter, partial [Thermoplasmata archaeon]|nr:cation:proton antiporter [Thermoplasmata archaeon]